MFTPSYPTIVVDNIQILDHPSHNGYTGKKAISNPNSRLFRMLVFLGGGSATKREIMRLVFNKIIGIDTTRSNNIYLYTQALRQGFISKNRVGNSVVYSLTLKGESVVINYREKTR